MSNLAKAYDKHKRGDLLGALLLYAHMAEMGYEVAQANAAVLLEEAREDILFCLHVSVVRQTPLRSVV